jgi:hypothetical protein
METNIPTHQLLPILQVLPRTDKRRIILFLSSQLAQEEGIDSSSVTGNYLDWKLNDASGAANTLLNMLADDKKA